MYQSDLKHDNHMLESKLQQLYTLNRDKKIDLSFRPPYLSLLKKLGNPHLHLPPVIHVAGTNGKGSTIAMLRAILEAAGYNVHAYTSPHLIKFNERIVIAGTEINDDTLESLIDEVLTLNNGGDLTFFEITTAIAFAAFARTPADICLLEVGMGGRLDCTNVIENPLVTIINRIAIDHAEHLGNTIEKIAAEKAGIMKVGAPCVIGEQSDEKTMDIFETIAHERYVQLYFPSKKNTLQTLSLLGQHQQNNAQIVLKTLELIHDQFPIQDAHIIKGFQNTQWRARLQRLDPEQYTLPDTYELYLDGGHNPDAAQALARQAKIWQTADNKNLIIILAMMTGKDTNAFISPLAPFAHKIYVTNIENEPLSQSAQQLHTLIPHAKIAHNYKAALCDIQNTSTSPPRILICGSLYLAGQVLKHSLE